MLHHILRGKKRGGSSSSDGEDLFEAYSIMYVPTKFLIDKEGNIMGKPFDEELDEMLEKIFGF